MKIGIDSYCYHRYFGEIYPLEQDPGDRMSLEDFLARAVMLQVDGVSLESCFMPDLGAGYVQDIGGFLDEHRLDRVYAWGHPDGLKGGASDEAYADMVRHIGLARAMGAPVMRVVGSSRKFQDVPREMQLERLARRFQQAVAVAAEQGVRLAIENHIDFNADQLLCLLHDVDSPYLGITFDSGNFLRLLDDPVKAMDKLKNHVYATHIKDVKPQKDLPADLWCFFASTPLGDGLIDNEVLARQLYQSGYEGLLAVEIDHLHADFGGDVDAAVERSVAELRRITRAVVQSA